MKAEELIKGLSTSADWLNALVLFGLGVAYVVVFLKILGQRRVQVFGVQFDVKSVWIVFVALTAAHGAVTILHLKNASALMFHPKGIEKGDRVRLQAWDELTINGPLVFRHVIQRPNLGLATLPNPFTPLRDPLAIPSYVSAAAMCAANVRWKKETHRSRVFWVLVGVLITLANWLIASWWIHGTAELRGSRDAAEYLKDVHQ
jgi:hypothetical protein